MLADPRPPHSFCPFPRDDLQRSLADRFYSQVELYPDRIAVCGSGTELTYDALGRAAGQVARAARAHGCAPSQSVPLLLGSDTSMVVAILGVLAAGGCCVPLDPANPDVRNRFILRDTDADLLMTDTAGMPQARRLASGVCSLLNVDDVAADTAEPLASTSPVAPDAPALVLYTSGSTGQPKGVILGHRFLMHTVMYHTNSRHIAATDRLSGLGRYHHVSGIADMFRALLNGAGLYAYDPRSQAIDDLAPWLSAHRITVLHCVPTLFRALARTLPQSESFPDLRLIVLGGEPVSQDDVRLYRSHFFSSCSLVNNLGSTELGPYGQFFLDKSTEIAGSIVPVHPEVDDKDVFLVDESTTPSDVGTVGEIAVRSTYMFSGYQSNHDRDDARFLADPTDGRPVFLTGDLGRLQHDGTLVHLGRKDSQVNVHGYRVELAELEASLRGLPMIQNAAIHVQDGERGNPRLVAYVVPAAQEAPTATSLRAALSEILPHYMMPSEFVAVESLPLTATGKVDRSGLSLLAPIGPSPETSFTPPSNDIERRLTELWEDILDVERIGLGENFFDLGGESVAAIRLANAISRQIGIRLPIVAIFEHPTIEELASLILDGQAGVTQSGASEGSG